METEKMVSTLKTWIAEQSEIPDTSESILKLFAHCSEGDIDAAKRNLFNYYSIRTTAFEGLFEGRDIDSESLTNTRNIFQTFMGPKKTPEGYKIMFSHAMSSDTKHYDMMSQMKYFVMTLEASLMDEEPSSGYIIVFDISTLAAGHILKFSPSGIKKTSNYLQEGIPLKIRNVYLVNASPLVDIMMKTAKPFLNMDLLKRTQIYKSGEIDKLYEQVPKECLPEEYGGDLGPSTEINEVNTSRLRRLKDKFAQEEAILKMLKETKSS